MKKFTALALVGILLILCLAGCSGGDEDVSDDTEQAADFLPDTTSVLADAQTESEESEDASQEDAVDVPIDESADESDSASVDTDDAVSAYYADATGQPTQTTNPFANYTYTTLSDTSFGFTLTYPTSWENLPGKYTVCFREVVEDGDVPARVAVTKKELAHKPKSSSTVLSQFQDYAEIIYNQYDSETFEFGELNSEATFMGETAFEIDYLAYSGDIEVEGYMICCAVDSAIYVFHFSASREDFEALDSVMTRIRDSVTIVE